MKFFLFTLFLLAICGNTIAQANWITGLEKDQYGDEIPNSKYVLGEFQGAFSDGTVAEERLQVGLGITKTDIIIIFLKYGKYQVSFDTAWNFHLYIKLKDGTEEKIMVKQRSNMLTVLDNENRKKMIDILKKESSVKCFYMECTESQPRPSYKFTINCTGFTKAYKEALVSW